MSSEIAVIDSHNLPLVAFSTKGGLDAVIDKIEADVKSVDRDISTEAGRDNVRALAFKLAKSKKEIERMALSLTEGWREQTALVNEEKKRGVQRMQELQDEIRAPLTAYEESEKERVRHLEGEIGAMTALLNFFDSSTSSEVNLRLDLLKAGWTKEIVWAEFTARATAEHDRVLNGLAAKLVSTLQSEADAAELSRLKAEEAKRQQEAHDAKIAADAKKAAEDKAAADAAALAEKVEADRAAAAQREADEKARADKAIADAAAAAVKAEEDKKAAEAAAAQRERDRIADEKRLEDEATRKREADKAHKAKINNESLASIKSLPAFAMFPEVGIKELITAIAQGKIPHVTIKY